MFTVTITLERTKYENYIKSVEPELEYSFGRSEINLNSDESNFYITIKSPDISSMRASLSSISRVLNVAKKIMEVEEW